MTPNILGREAQPLPRHAGASSSGVSSGSSPREGVNVAAGASGGAGNLPQLFLAVALSTGGACIMRRASRKGPPAPSG